MEERQSRLSSVPEMLQTLFLAVLLVLIPPNVLFSSLGNARKSRDRVSDQLHLEQHGSMTSNNSASRAAVQLSQNAEVV